MERCGAAIFAAMTGLGRFKNVGFGAIGGNSLPLSVVIGHAACRIVKPIDDAADIPHVGRGRSTRSGRGRGS